MMVRRIAGVTRVVGQRQGYLGLPLRDVVVDDTVTGPETPAMETAWEPDPHELEMLAAGGSVILHVVGRVHPPVMLRVEHDGAGSPLPPAAEKLADLAAVLPPEGVPLDDAALLRAAGIARRILYA